MYIFKELQGFQELHKEEKIEKVIRSSVNITVLIFRQRKLGLMHVL